MNRILEWAEKVSQQVDVDWAREKSYLEFQVPHICELHSLNIKSDRIRNWLNGYYREVLAVRSKDYVDYVKKCREAYSNRYNELMRRNNNRPVAVFSFEHVYGVYMKVKMQSIANNLLEFKYV